MRLHNTYEIEMSRDVKINSGCRLRHPLCRSTCV